MTIFYHLNLQINTVLSVLDTETKFDHSQSPNKVILDYKGIAGQARNDDYSFFDFWGSSMKKTEFFYEKKCGGSL